MAFRSTPFIKAIAFTLTLLVSQSSIAQLAAHSGYLSALAPNFHEGPVPVEPILSVPKLTGDSVGTFASAVENKRLLNYLKELGIPDQQYKYPSNKKFYYHLANVFARLRMYPLAMKCFFKAARFNRSDIDSLHLADTVLNAPPVVSFSSKDDSLVDTKVRILKTNPKVRKSKRTSFSQISGNFNDGKTAVAYALLFHVKQPAPGKRKIFVWVNTGHTFITLIKYNSDSTYTSASFGFYPDKDHFLSASPIFPTTTATFKDDSGHLWDEVLGKFISKRKFERILELTRNFEGMAYNLNRQNCTDFGLQAAGLAGIHIVDTFGKWPLGKGNNPAVTGQSILSGKVISDVTSSEQIFIDDTVRKKGWE
ncbi:hypothetical protein [Pedobacter sp. L105]|uniref:hypothetical protein n=1 Tax=Pedobacter sp. L105 TaxID=1641871 RepID=UPI00131E5113|nr:hypothetical protein [Pedobacter sp. L105]